MWYVVFLIFAAVVVLSVFGGGTFTLIGLPLAAIIALGRIAWFVVSGRESRDVPQVVGAAKEPTGKVRGAPGSTPGEPETSNERIGQE